MTTKHITFTGYLFTYLALIALATVSLLFSLLHLTTVDLVVSLVAAGLKTFLVLWFFMHLAEQRFTNRLIVLVALGFVALLVSLTALDVASRKTSPAAPRPTAGDALYRR